jgi:hypothetical protein
MSPSFSYGMLEFDTNSILTYSTLKTMGLGEGISNSPLKGSIGDTLASDNAIPYGGGHIPPFSPLIDGSFQPSFNLNMNYNLFGVGNLGPCSYTTPVGSMSFSLFSAFGNNYFLSVVISVGGNPGFGQQNPVQGALPTHGEST